MHKKAALFELGMVLWTVILCGLVIIMQLTQQEHVTSSLISPQKVLEQQDAQELFEMREEQHLQQTWENLQQQEITKESYISTFRTTYFKKILADEHIKTFLTANLYINNNAVSFTDLDYQEFITNYVYPEAAMTYDGTTLTINRQPLTKKELLKGENLESLNFPVTYTKTFSKTITIPQKKEEQQPWITEE